MYVRGMPIPAVLAVSTTTRYRYTQTDDDSPKLTKTDPTENSKKGASRSAAPVFASKDFVTVVVVLAVGLAWRLFW